MILHHSVLSMPKYPVADQGPRQELLKKVSKNKTSDRWHWRVVEITWTRGTKIKRERNQK